MIETAKGIEKQQLVELIEQKSESQAMSKWQKWENLTTADGVSDCSQLSIELNNTEDSFLVCWDQGLFEVALKKMGKRNLRVYMQATLSKVLLCKRSSMVSIVLGFLNEKARMFVIITSPIMVSPLPFLDSTIYSWHTNMFHFITTVTI